METQDEEKRNYISKVNKTYGYLHLHQNLQYTQISL